MACLVEKEDFHIHYTEDKFFKNTLKNEGISKDSVVIIIKSDFFNQKININLKTAKKILEKDKKDAMYNTELLQCKFCDEDRVKEDNYKQINYEDPFENDKSNNFLKIEHSYLCQNCYENFISVINKIINYIEENPSKVMPYFLS